MPHFESIDQLLAALESGIEQPEEHSEWLEIDQPRVDAFAAATDDPQWIHVDQARAAAGPYGTTIAHGFLTLSLIPSLTRHAVEVDGTGMRINYGLDRVRFVAPVRVGSRVRASTSILSAEPGKNGVLVRLRVTISIENQDKPAAVAEQLVLVIPEDAA